MGIPTKIMCPSGFEADGYLKVETMIVSTIVHALVVIG
jgi:hypothetical protein